MANTAICNARHVISNLRSQFLLISPYERRGYGNQNHKLLIPHSVNSQIPQQQQ